MVVSVSSIHVLYIFFSEQHKKSCCIYIHVTRDLAKLKNGYLLLSHVKTAIMAITVLYEEKSLNVLSIQLSTDGEASQVIDVATAGQKRNAAVVNSLYYLQTAMTRLIDSQVQGYEAESMQIIYDNVQVMHICSNSFIYV